MYPHDDEWKFFTAGEKMMHGIKMFQQRGPFEAVGFRTGADFCDTFKPYIEDGKTVVTSLCKIFGPQTNDLVLQLRKYRISQLILGEVNFAMLFCGSFTTDEIIGISKRNRTFSRRLPRRLEKVLPDCGGGHVVRFSGCASQPMNIQDLQ